MGEKRLLVEGLTVSYAGYFHAKELHKLIRRFTAERGYDPHDVLHEVKVKEDGRYIILDMRPDKTVSDYVKFRIQIKLVMDKITDAIIEIDSKKIKINNGSVKATINGFILTDYESDWQTGAKKVFFKLLFDKFIYKKHMDEMDAMLKKDCSLLRHEISSFLNINKYIKDVHE